MPTYEYKCDLCDHEFEKLVESQFRDKQKCNECKTDKVVRKFNSVPSHFSGDGFYSKTNNEK